MTKVEFDFSQDDGPDHGTVTFTPTRRRRHDRSISMPEPFAVNLPEDGRFTAELTPTPPSWLWRITKQINEGMWETNYYYIPDQHFPIPFAYLHPVDPSTVQVGLNPEPAWWAWLDGVKADARSIGDALFRARTKLAELDRVAGEIEAAGNAAHELIVGWVEESRKLREDTERFRDEAEAFGGTNDQIIANIVNRAMKSETRHALDKHYYGAGVGVYNLQSVASDLTNITAAIQTAIDTVPEGSLIVVPPGEYTTTGTIRKTGKSIAVDTTGCVFKQGGNSIFAQFEGEWDGPYSITNIAETTITNRNNSIEPVTRLTVAQPSAWQIGDVVKVFSNDFVIEARNDGGDLRARRGEFMTVKLVSGNAIYLSGLMVDRYINNPRVAKMNKKTVKWRGGEYVGSDESFTNNWTGPVFSITGMYKPRIDDYVIRRSSAAGLNLRSNYMPVVTDYEVGFLENNTTSSSANQFGYGVNDLGNYKLTVKDSAMNNTRHAYTDDVTPIVADETDINRYGRPMFATVENVISTGSTAGAFSPHHGGYGHKFKNCFAKNTAGAGYGMRGTNHVVESCSDLNGDISINAFNERGGKTSGIKVINHVSNGSRVAVARSGGTYYDEATLEISGGSFSNTIRAASVSNGYVSMTNDPKFAFAPDISSVANSIQVSSAMLNVAGSLTLDYSLVTTGSVTDIVAIGGGSPQRFKADKIIFKNTAMNNRYDRFFGTLSGGADTAIALCDEIVCDVPITNIAVGIDFVRSAYKWRTFDSRQNDSYRSVSGYGLRTNFGIGAAPNTSPVIYHKITSNDSINHTAGGILPGKFPGQLFVFTFVRTAGTGVLRIPNNDEFATMSGETVELQNRQSMILVWDIDTTKWRELKLA